MKCFGFFNMGEMYNALIYLHPFYIYQVDAMLSCWYIQNIADLYSTLQNNYQSICICQCFCDDTWIAVDVKVEKDS